MFTRRYDDRHRFTLTNAVGAIDDAQLLEHSLAMEEECIHRPAQRELAMLQPGLDVSGLTTEGMRHVAGLEKTRNHIRGGHLAIVADEPLLIGISRVFTAHATLRPTAVVIALDEALEELGLTPVRSDLQPLIDAAMAEWR